jgi:hypothetical protein
MIFKGAAMRHIFFLSIGIFLLATGCATTNDMTAYSSRAWHDDLTFRDPDIDSDWAIFDITPTMQKDSSIEMEYIKDDFNELFLR